MTGATPEHAARELEAAGADVVGANCGQSIDGYAAILRQLRAGTLKPVWLKPNAGLPELRDDGSTRYASSSDEFAAHAPALLREGVQFLGGCCGTAPEFIAALRAAVDKWQSA
jgi:5-methyltetrahydrofolate--homocysteine methyltransferase